MRSPSSQQHPNFISTSQPTFNSGSSSSLKSDSEYFYVRGNSCQSVCLSVSFVNFIIMTSCQPSLDASVYLNILHRLKNQIFATLGHSGLVQETFCLAARRDKADMAVNTAISSRLKVSECSRFSLTKKI